MELDYRLTGLLVVAVAAVILFLYQVRGLTLWWFGKLMLHMLIGVFFLFFLNLFGQFLHLYIPLNLITVPIAGFLGWPGVLALVFIQLFIL